MVPPWLCSGYPSIQKFQAGIVQYNQVTVSAGTFRHYLLCEPPLGFEPTPLRFLLSQLCSTQPSSSQEHYGDEADRVWASAYHTATSVSRWTNILFGEYNLSCSCRYFNLFILVKNHGITVMKHQYDIWKFLWLLCFYMTPFRSLVQFEPHLLWIPFIFNMDKELNPLWSLEWNYLSIHKLEHHTLYWAYDCLSILAFKGNPC